MVNANGIFLGSKLSNLESRKVALSVHSEVTQQKYRQWRAEKIKFVPGKLDLESDLMWGMVPHAYYPNTEKTEQKNLKFKSQPTVQGCLKNQTTLTMKQTIKKVAREHQAVNYNRVSICGKCAKDDGNCSTGIAL